MDGCFEYISSLGKCPEQVWEWCVVWVRVCIFCHELGLFYSCTRSLLLVY